MKIAIIGSGGREHALGWKFAQSIDRQNVFFIPGNGGTWNNVPLAVTDFAAIEQFCAEKEIDLLFVGPEDPLANGIVDYFADKDIRIFGPDRNAARLEGSKIWAKQFMKRYGVATADFWIPEDTDQIRQIAQELDGQVVVKYDGLAAGKGVFVCSSTTEVYQAIDTIQSRYGLDAPYIMERKMTGQELSVIGFTDGQTIRLLLPSQDHKPAFDGDRGPNTGGMGAYCPVPLVDDRMMEKSNRDVVQPTLQGIMAEKLNYKGVIYFGLMLTDQGPQVLEYNVRFGDPETEVILPALKSDLLEVTMATLSGALDQIRLDFNPGYFVDVVLASGGYPDKYAKGKRITGLDRLSSDILVFHAGTKQEGDALVTSGGRVLNVVGRGETLPQAIENTYRAVEQIAFDGMFYRKDIAAKGLK